MTSAEALGYGCTFDTILVDRITEEGYDTIPQAYCPEVEDVRKFRIKEDWIFDKQTGIMKPRIIGICPVLRRYDESGNFLGEFPMFWIYYPDLRTVLMNKQSFNPFNNSQPISWDDVFEMRLFGSTIVKEENLYDRRIEDYATGIDALLEHDRIRMELFTIEHDLWDY